MFFLRTEFSIYFDIFDILLEEELPFSVDIQPVHQNLFREIGDYLCYKNLEILKIHFEARYPICKKICLSVQFLKRKTIMVSPNYSICRMGSDLLYETDFVYCVFDSDICNYDPLKVSTDTHLKTSM